MARIYLACEASTENHPFARRDYERLLEYAGKDTIRKHTLSDHPENSDLIAFVGSSMPDGSDVRSSTLYQQYKENSVLFHSGDKVIPVLPGVYTCLEKRWYTPIRKGVRSGFYLRVAENDSMDLPERIEEARFLFSFVGSSANHSVRKKICRLRDERGCIVDTTEEQEQSDGVSGENRVRGLHYRDVMARSRFVLCPAGKGVATWRLFETMRAGRVPVIIADRWIPTEGPDWQSFSVFVAEKDVGSISERLRYREAEAFRMGAAARQAWETFFSAERAFSTLVDLLVAAHREYQSAGLLSKTASVLQYAEPFFLRYCVLSPIKQALFKR